MSSAVDTVSIGRELAVVAVLVGLGCVLFVRRSVPRALLVTMTVVVGLSGVCALAQLIELKPTHALLSDSESTAPQKVVDGQSAPAEAPRPPRAKIQDPAGTDPTGGGVHPDSADPGDSVTAAPGVGDAGKPDVSDAGSGSEQTEPTPAPTPSETAATTFTEP